LTFEYMTSWLYRKLSCIERFPYIVWTFIPLLSGNEWGY
jgi:hypothetical protein